VSAAKIFGKPRDEILGDIGYALQQVKRSRGLTSDDMRVVFGLKDDDMVAKYIAGDNAMSVVSWLRALEAWPELPDLITESDTERALKGRQRELRLPDPQPEARAA
jgi:hypothetical protein